MTGPSGVRTAPANGITLAYETFGDSDAVPVLLVMGLGTQMIAWHDGFCELLADRGHFVIRFDNRDIGLSTHLDDQPPGRPVGAFLSRRPPYFVADMADDAAALLTELRAGRSARGRGVDGRMHQPVIDPAPSIRGRSLTSISSSTGSRRVGRPRLDIARTMLTRRAATSRSEAVAFSVATWRRIGSPGYPFDLARVERLAGEAYDRRYDPAGAPGSSRPSSVRPIAPLLSRRCRCRPW